MDNQDQKNWFDDIELVIKDDTKFKKKLDIGEEAYLSLRIKNTVFKISDTGGAALAGAGLAKSTFIATTFFAPKGLLAFIGLGTATTPLGWVILAGVVAGGAWVGISHYFDKTKGELVTVIPKYINTQLDLLASGLFGLISPLALKVAKADNNIGPHETLIIKNYFVDEWGYDESYVNKGITFAELKLDDYSIEELAKTLADFKKQNPDCNYNSMSAEILKFFENVIKSDGNIDEREQKALDAVKIVFSEVGKSYFDTAVEVTTDVSSNIIQKIKILLKKARDMVSNAFDWIVKQRKK